MSNKTQGEYYSDFDQETTLWCVFHTDLKSGHAFASYSSEDQAVADATRRNLK